MSQRNKIVFLLKFVTKTLDEAGIDYWLDYGTLLGAVRNKGFISNDSDADISIYEKDAKKAFEVLQWSAIPYKLSIRTGFRGAGLQVYHPAPSTIHMDVFFWYPDGDMLRRKWYVPGTDDNKGKDFPAEWMGNMSTVVFERRRYKAPEQAEKLVEHRYGPTWRKRLGVGTFNATPNPHA